MVAGFKSTDKVITLSERIEYKIIVKIAQLRFTRQYYEPEKMMV